MGRKSEFGFDASAFGGMRQKKDKSSMSMGPAGKGARGIGKAAPKPKRPADSPETKRRKLEQARARRDAKRGGPAGNPADRGHISNAKIYAALYNGGKPKQMAAAAANAHPSMAGKERESYIKRKLGEDFDRSKIKTTKKKK